jgi:hypothetical protein
LGDGVGGKKRRTPAACLEHEEAGPSSSEHENDQDVIASDLLVGADSVVMNGSSVNNPVGGMPLSCEGHRLLAS